ncbi:MAG: Bcr/CflA family efflux MFS transporter [Chthoniobacterales bacterium]
MSLPPFKFKSESQLPEKQTYRIFWLLLPLLSLNGMAIDLIAPSLPAIAINLHASASTVKNLITIYLLGFALGNFCSGFLTDSLGRKHILRTALLGFFMANLLPVIIPNINVLLLARFFQGITLGSIAIVIRAVVSDILPPQKLVRAGTLMGSMYGIGTVIGPLIGGYLQFYIGWKACFLFFAIVSFIVLIVIFFILPETSFQRHPLKLKIIRQNLLEVFRHRPFMALVLMMGNAYSLVIVFNTAGPFLVQTVLHHTSIFFGNIALCLGASFLAATFFCRYLIKKYQVEYLLAFITHAVFIMAVVAWVISILFNVTIFFLLGISIFVFFAVGSIFPMCMGKGISLFRHLAGTAGAVMFLINVLMTTVLSFLLSLIKVQNSSTMIAIDAVLLGSCLLIYWFAIRPSSKNIPPANEF